VAGELLVESLGMGMAVTVRLVERLGDRLCAKLVDRVGKRLGGWLSERFSVITSYMLGGRLGE
jgi:hypothetical protein